MYKSVVALVLALVVSLAGPSSAMAATSVGLGTADDFAVLAGSGITNTGATTITGDVGSHPTTTQTGFGTVTLNGTNHMGDSVTQGAKTDLVTAYNDAAGRTPVSTVPTELGGTTKTAGVYDSSAGTFGITGTLTLDAQGDPNAFFIFKAASTLITASSSTVTLVNGAQACNVFWQVGSSATLGTTSNFIGNILALTAITDDGGSTVRGRLLARNAAVTLNNSVITRATCSSAAATSASSDDGSGGSSSEPAPGISLTKVASPIALPDGAGPVQYTYQVTNSGDLPLSQVSLVDNRCTPITFMSGDRNSDSVLDLDELWTYRCTTEVTRSVRNTATVHGFAEGVEVRDTAYATVVVGDSPPPPGVVVVPKLPNAGIGWGSESNRISTELFAFLSLFFP